MVGGGAVIFGMHLNFPLMAGCIPMLVLVSALYFERWQHRRKGMRLPMSEKLLRPAGYTLSRQLDVFWADCMVWLLGALLASLLAVGVFQTPQKKG